MISEKTIKDNLKLLEARVHSFLALMDVVMLEKESVARGKKIADLCNQLDIANQVAARFGLGIHRVGGKIRKVK